MTVLEKLEKRIRQLDMNLSVNMVGRSYSFAQADERELLEAARDEIVRLKQQFFVGADDLPDLTRVRWND